MNRPFIDGAYTRKIKTVEELVEIIGDRPREKKVIMCHGTFDVVHPGHIRHLIYAKEHGDILVASLTDDRNVGKANFRPYVPEELRAMNLAALEMVDYVLIDREAAPLKNLERLKPDFFAKGYEYVSEGMPAKTLDEANIVEAYGGEILFTPGDIVYSSSAIIEHTPPELAVEKLAILMEAENIGFGDLRAALDGFSGERVHVVGDTIVDSHTQCTMIGGMTKTPTFSVRYENVRDFTGGAAIVSKHLQAAGANVVFSTVLGEDAFKIHVLEDLAAAGVDCRPIIDETRPTTNKNAFVAGGYRLLKVDTLDNRSISDKIVTQLCDAIANTESDTVVMSDFRHGIYNRATVPRLTAAIPGGTFRVADSQVASRWGNILDFTGFDLITPNEREARFALGDQDSVVRPLGRELFARAECATLIMKLGERGILTFRSADTDDYRAFFAIDSFASEIVDAVGAGDALLAYAALAMRTTKSEAIASILGSFAAAVECEHDGNIPVSPDNVRQKIDIAEKIFNFG